MNVHNKNRISNLNNKLTEESMLAAGYECISLPATMSSDEFIRSMIWCNDNLIGESHILCGKFWFSDSRDALAFKMVWL